MVTSFLEKIGNEDDLNNGILLLEQGVSFSC
jgi:hypothetical protein